MRTIITAESRHTAEIRQLCEEYLRWANARVLEEFGTIFDTEEIIESTMQHLDAFMPPCGRTLLGYVDGDLAGMACLKELTPHIGEIKRMYVRPAQRRQGLGRAFIERLLDESREIGYERVRLDSAGFMHEAHAVYHAAGFHEIDAYEGSEIPPEFRKHWVFMEKDLQPEAAAMRRV